MIISFKGKELKRGDIVYVWRGGPIEEVKILRCGPIQSLLKRDRASNPHIASTYGFFNGANESYIFLSRQAAEDAAALSHTESKITKSLNAVRMMARKETLDKNLLSRVVLIADELASLVAFEEKREESEKKSDD